MLDPKPTPILCPVPDCSCSFPDVCRLIGHVETDHAESVFVCPVPGCEYFCCGAPLFRDHCESPEGVMAHAIAFGGMLST
jgi:hypothetical protein